MSSCHSEFTRCAACPSRSVQDSVTSRSSAKKSTSNKLSSSTKGAGGVVGAVAGAVLLAVLFSDDEPSYNYEPSNFSAPNSSRNYSQESDISLHGQNLEQDARTYRGASISSHSVQYFTESCGGGEDIYQVTYGQAPLPFGIYGYFADADGIALSYCDNQLLNTNMQLSVGYENSAVDFDDVDKIYYDAGLSSFVIQDFSQRKYLVGSPLNDDFKRRLTEQLYYVVFSSNDGEKPVITAVMALEHEDGLPNRYVQQRAIMAKPSSGVAFERLYKGINPALITEPKKEHVLYVEYSKDVKKDLDHVYYDELKDIIVAVSRGGRSYLISDEIDETIRSRLHGITQIEFINEGDHRKKLWMSIKVIGWSLVMVQRFH